jgi:non-specific serine/threonine protein kinase/serine/threonine-protein kinase
MTREQWLRVKTITAAALEQPEARRAGFVTDACAGEEPLEQEVRSLLSSAVSASPLFEAPVFAAASAVDVIEQAARAAAPRIGGRFGPYRIIKEIGRGGMGRVFLAERADEEYRQVVALKIAHDARSAEGLRSFRDERQILATLQHPNIARLMDGGTTEEGVPYLVMEHVQGVPIDEYCTANALTLRQRLELFGTICAAVDVAHRNLVVHRDLKPSNILVSSGVPKLLDFGIAKLLEPSGNAAAAGAQSNTGPAMLTPEYASPEQLKREPVTTATDVYALGVLLFRLLTNVSPYRVRSYAPHELAAAICDQEPLRPSAVASARPLRRQLAGDLDTIVLKALRKNPAERYSSAAALADDITRYLTGLPLAARDDGWLYRSAKFIARHRVGVTAAALVVVSLVAGLAAALWQAREAERQRQLAQRHFDDVRRLASSLIFEVQDSIENVPGALATRELLVKRALEYFDGLAAEEKDNVGLQQELAQAYDKLGNVLGRSYASNVGDTAAALASYEKALAIREQLATSGAVTSAAQLDLWSSYFNVGGILRETADTAGALKLHQSARAVLDDLLRKTPDDLKLVRAVAQTASTLSLSYVQSGRLDDAMEAARRTVTLDERLLSANPSDLAMLNEVATARGRLGQILLKLGDLAGARAQFEPAFDAASKLVTAQPDNVAFRRRLSSTHSHFAQLFVRQGDLKAAWPHQQTALSLRQEIVDGSPADRQASIDLMVSQLETGEVLARRGDYREAAAHYRQALARGEPFVASDPSYVYFRLTVATALTRLSLALVAARDAAAAEAISRRAVDLVETASANDPADARLRFELAMAYATMGDALAAHAGSGALLTSEGEDRSPRAWYLRSLEVLNALRASGRRAGGPLDDDEPQLIATIERKLVRLR